MAVLYFTSANSIDTSHLPGPFSAFTGMVTIGNGDGPMGINTIHLPANGSVACSNLAIPPANGMTAGCGFTMGAITNSVALWSFGPTQVIINPDGSVTVSGGSGAGNQRYIVPSGTISFGVRNYIELTCLDWTGNAGTAVLYVGGVQVGSGTIGSGFGQNTFGGTLTSAVIGAGGAAGTVVIDSIYVADRTGTIGNNPLGPIIVGVIIPSAPGTKADWTPHGAGTDWEAVNIIPPPGDTSYIADSTIGDECAVAMTNPSIFASIQAVSVVTDARQTQAGARSILVGVGDGTSQSYGPTGVALNTAYATNTTVFNDDPNNAHAAWTLSAINAIQAAVKVHT